MLAHVQRVRVCRPVRHRLCHVCHAYLSSRIRWLFQQSPVALIESFDFLDAFATLQRLPAMRYLFCLNGAAIKMHDSEKEAMRQARQWKASNLSRRVTVEEYFDHSSQGYIPTYRIVQIEIPMLVPSLTPQNDWDQAGR